jgi:mannose-1-phosphate guanylyltransferase/mannose-6-phosphate isomerase
LELYVPEGESESLLAAAIRSVKPFSIVPLIISVDGELADKVREHIRRYDLLKEHEYQLLVEPYPRGNAFTIALAAAQLKLVDPNAVMLVLPVNQEFEVDDRWTPTVTRCYRAAADEKVAVLAINAYSSTEAVVSHRGYIRPGSELKGILGAYQVRSYIADPPPSLAYRVAQQGALWGTGIMMMRATLALAELRGAPSRSDELAAQGAARIAETATFLVALGAEHWSNKEAQAVLATLPDVNYEQAVLENSNSVAVIPSTIEFKTFASLESFEQTLAPDANLNRLNGRALTVDSHETTVLSNAGKLVVTLGTEDLLVIDTPDATLIASKHALRQIEDVTDALRELQAPELLDFRD